MADMPLCMGNHANRSRRLCPVPQARRWMEDPVSESRMTDVTVVFLDGTFSSTAVGPMEVFRITGTLWNALTGIRPAPRFRVTTASADGRAVRCEGPIRIQPDAALSDIRKTDLIFLP